MEKNSIHWLRCMRPFSKSCALVFFLGGALASAKAQEAPSHTGPGDIVVTGRSLKDCDEPSGTTGVVEAMGARDVRFLVLGEIHGTNEIPSFFGSLICGASKQRKLHILLEINEKYQKDLDIYFKSTESGESLDNLLKSGMWSTGSDGRSSVAMLDLLEFLKRMIATGSKVQVFATQPARPQRLVSQAYFELATADKWMTVADTDPDALNVALVGNLQASKSRESDYGFQPASAHLPPGEIVTFSPESLGGETWSCSGPALDCGPSPVAGGGSKGRYIALYAQTINGYDGRYCVGRKFSPSEPAGSR